MNVGSQYVLSSVTVLETITLTLALIHNNTAAMWVHASVKLAIQLQWATETFPPGWTIAHGTRGTLLRRCECIILNV